MLKEHDVISFAATAQPNRARKFYREVLGLNLVEESPVALVLDVGGRMLRIQKVQTLAPAPHTVLGWSVPDIRGEIESLQTRGVIFERYPGMSQDDLGVWTSPGLQDFDRLGKIAGQAGGLGPIQACPIIVRIRAHSIRQRLDRPQSLLASLVLGAMLCVQSGQQQARFAAMLDSMRQIRLRFIRAPHAEQKLGHQEMRLIGF